MGYRVLIALVALVGLTAFAPAPFIVKPKKKEAPPQQLEGLWEVVVRNGTKIPVNGAPYRIRIEPGKWTFDRTGALGKGPGKGARSVSYFLKVDTKASPPKFDLHRKENDPTAYGQGIYELKGDELRIAYSFGGFRPDGLDSSKSRVVRFTMRRVRN